MSYVSIIGAPSRVSRVCRCIVQVADFHCPHRSCQDAGLAPDAESPLEAKEFEVCVGEAFSPGREGYWASLEDGGDEGKANPNPYAGAVVVTAVDGAAAGKRKVDFVLFFRDFVLGGGGLCLYAASLAIHRE